MHEVNYHVLKQTAMSRAGDNESDGSDIEVDEVLDDDRIGARDLPDRLELAQEMADEHMDFMFNDSSLDEEFAGFPRHQDDWVTDGFVEQLEAHAYRKTPGPNVVFAADSSPVQYFEHFWDAGLWQHLVTETNR